MFLTQIPEASENQHLLKFVGNVPMFVPQASKHQELFVPILDVPERRSSINKEAGATVVAFGRMTRAINLHSLAECLLLQQGYFWTALGHGVHLIKPSHILQICSQGKNKSKAQVGSLRAAAEQPFTLLKQMSASCGLAAESRRRGRRNRPRCRQSPHLEPSAAAFSPQRLPINTAVNRWCRCSSKPGFRDSRML